MSRVAAGPLVVVMLAGLIVAGGLGACGKKSTPTPPEGEESRYTWPRTYPAPTSVLQTEDDVTTDETTDETGAAGPPHAGDITPFPGTRTTTTIYGSPQTP